MYTFNTISSIQWCYIFQVDDAHPSTGEGSRAAVSTGPTTSPAATLPAADNVESGEECTSEDTSSALDSRPRRKPRKTAQTQQRSALDQVKKIFGFYLL